MGISCELDFHIHHQYISQHFLLFASLRQLEFLHVKIFVLQIIFLCFATLFLFFTKVFNCYTLCVISMFLSNVNSPYILNTIEINCNLWMWYSTPWSTAPIVSFFIRVGSSPCLTVNSHS